MVSDRTEYSSLLKKFNSDIIFMNNFGSPQAKLWEPWPPAAFGKDFDERNLRLLLSLSK